MNYYLAIIAASLGQGSSRPLRKAYYKLAILSLGSLLLGILLSRSVPHLPRATPEQSLQWCTSVIFAVQIVTLFSLLSAMGINNAVSDKLQGLLLVLPFKPVQRKLMLLLPSLLLMAIGLLFAGPLLGALVLPTGLWPGLFAAALVIGSVSALGMTYGLCRRNALRLVIVGLLVYGEYKLSVVIHTSHQPFWTIVFLALSLLLCAMAVRSAGHIQSQIGQITKTTSVHAIRLPISWFGKKFIRSPITILSLCMTFVLALAVAFTAIRLHLLDYQLVTLVATVLAAGLASDVRAISRRLYPPEIAAVRGSYHFIVSEFLAIAVACFVSVVPLLWLTLADNPWQVIVRTLLGIAVGFLASTLLVPAKRDISGQVATGLLCIALTVIPARFGITTNPYLMLLLTAGLLAISFAIEYKRNTYTWRSYAK